MAKNEAKIKFTAETGKFNDQIKKSNKEMSELRAELKLNDAQMKNNGTSVEALEKKHDILESQLAASQDKTEALNQKLEKAVEIFGENSDEASKLKVQLANAQTAEQNLQKAIANCEKEISEQTRAQKEAESASKQLSDSIGDQEKQLSKLKSEYADAVMVYGKNSDEAKQLGKEINTLSNELKENKDKLAAAEKEADKFDNALDDVGKTSETTVPKLDKLAIGIAAIGAAAIAAGKAAIDAFNEVDEGADNVIKATGATGEAAAELEESYKKVASSIVGDFGNIGSTLGEVNTRFGYTGSEAEEATTKFLKFSEITGVDSVEAVQAVTRALNDSGIPLNEYDTLLDQLAKAGQSAGIDVTTLADSLSENGSIMRSMGFDTQETIALLAQFELSGANSSAMLTGMKKAMATWADEGKNGNVEFAKMVKGIQNGSVTAADAIDVFGTKAGPMLVDAIKSGKFEYNDMLNVIKNSEGTLESTFDGTVDGGYELELAMQNAKMALAEAGGEIGTALIPAFKTFSENVLPVATKAIGAMVDGISSAVGWMKEHKGIVTALGVVIGVLATAITAYNVVQGIKTAMDAANVTTVWALVAAHWAQATAAMAAIAPYILVVAAIAAVIAIIVVCVKYWDNIVEAVKNCWDAVVRTLSQWGTWIYTNVIQPIANFFVGLWNGIVTGVQAAWTWCVNLFSTVANWIYTTVIQPIANFFVGLWNGIVNAFHTVIDPWIEIVKRAAALAYQNIILPIKNYFVNLWNSIVSGLQAAWNWCVSIASAVAGWVNANVIQPVTNFFVGLWNKIKSGASAAWSGIKSVFSTISNWVNSKVVEPVKNAFSNAWNAVKNGASNAWNGIKSVFSKVASFFGDIFSKAWQKVKSVFSAGGKIFDGIKDGIVTAFKTVVNAIIKGINKVVSIPFNGLNKILGKLAGINILGVSPFSWLTWRASVPQIPLLAQGGYVAANSPQLAIVGDNKHEGEIIAPESKIAEAVERGVRAVNLEALAAAVEDLASRPIALNINGRQFAIATAGDTDNISGMRTRFKERGLILD